MYNPIEKNIDQDENILRLTLNIKQGGKFSRSFNPVTKRKSIAYSKKNINCSQLEHNPEALLCKMGDFFFVKFI